MTNRIEATGVGNARARTKRGAAVNLCSKKKKRIVPLRSLLPYLPDSKFLSVREGNGVSLVRSYLRSSVGRSVYSSSSLGPNVSLLVVLRLFLTVVRRFHYAQLCSRGR